MAMMAGPRAVWSLLTPPQRRGAVGLVVMMLCAAVLEMIGVGVIVPGLGFLVQDAASPQASIGARWWEWLGRPSDAKFISAGLLAVLVIYMIKAAFLMQVAERQARFVAAVQGAMSRRLFATYLAQPWEFHLQRNSAELIRNIDAVQVFAVSCTAVLTMISEGLVLLALVALMVAYEPLGACVVGVVLYLSTRFYDRLTRPRLERWGRSRHEHAAACVKYVQEALGGVREVKMLQCEDAFIQRFGIDSDGLARMSGRQAMFQQVPRLWYELLAVASLCILGWVMMWQGRPMGAFIPILGLFAAAAFRLLPSVHRFSMALQQIRFATEQTATLRRELLLPSKNDAPENNSAMQLRERVEITDVSYTYPGRIQPALKGVRLAIPFGQSIGLVGRSGSGKSTLVDVLLGLLDPDAGRVTVDGMPISANLPAWRRSIGYVPQTIFLCDDSLRRNIAFGMAEDQINEAAVQRAIELAQLTEFVDSLEHGLDTLIGERGVRLSGGQRQRIGIARALYHRPRLLVLDEATSALDTITEKEVMSAVNALHGDTTVVIVAHRMSTVADCDCLYRMEDGAIAGVGTYSEITAGGAAPDRAGPANV